VRHDLILHLAFSAKHLEIALGQGRDKVADEKSSRPAGLAAGRSSAPRRAKPPCGRSAVQWYSEPNVRIGP